MGNIADRKKAGWLDDPVAELKDTFGSVNTPSAATSNGQSPTASEVTALTQKAGTYAGPAAGPPSQRQRRYRPGAKRLPLSTQPNRTPPQPSTTLPPRPHTVVESGDGRTVVLNQTAALRLLEVPESPVMSRQQAFEVVKVLRRVVKAMTPKSPRTMQAYARRWARMEESGLAADLVLANSKSRSDFDQWRGAFLWGMEDGLEKALQRMQELQCDRTGDADLHFIAIAEHVRVALAVRQRIANAAPPAFPKTRRIRKKSKKKTYEKLPAGFLDAHWAAIPAAARWRIGAAVQMMTGCRPIEIEDPGAQLWIEGEKVLATIRTAKTGAGVEDYRTVWLTLDSAPAQFLHDQVIQAGGYLIVRAPAGGVRKVLRSAGRRAFPALRTSVTGYVYRHAVAAAGKAQDGEETTAQILGHADGGSQSSYAASWQAQSGGPRVQIVETTRPVRRLKGHPPPHTKALRRE